jgi:predicted transcriptional regulator
MGSAFELLAFVARSENRVEALQALEAAPASRAELQAATGIPRATLSRILADFQARDLAERDGYEFTITPLGRLLAGELRSTFESLEVGSELQSLTPWLPLSELGIDVEHLADARVTLPTPVDPLAPVNRTATVLAAGDRVRGLCNNVIPELLQTLGGARAEVEVVATADAFEVVSANPTTSGVVRRMLQSGRLDLAVSSEWFPQLAIETDGTVLLEVTDDDGAIHGLIESETDAVRSWFASAFDAYRSQARRVAPELLAP